MPALSCNREDVPCDSDEHRFRTEVYEWPADEVALHGECCQRCGWSWDEINAHDAGDCCCPAGHSSDYPDLVDLGGEG